MNVGGTGGEIGDVFMKIMFIIIVVFIVYDWFFDRAALTRIPHDISNYVSSWTHHPAPKH